MLHVFKQFKIITNAINDEMLSDFLEFNRVEVEQEHYTEYPWLNDDEVMMTLDCRVNVDKFDKLVKGLKNLFKDQEAIITY